MSEALIRFMVLGQIPNTTFYITFFDVLVVSFILIFFFMFGNQILLKISDLRAIYDARQQTARAHDPQLHTPTTAKRQTQYMHKQYTFIDS